MWAFTEFECREFLSWVKNWSAAAGAALGVVRGVEVEWDVPKGSEMVTCADGAVLVNATAVRGGMWCAYDAGLIGDGFARGTVCSKGTRILSMIVPAVCHASNHCEFENFRIQILNVCLYACLACSNSGQESDDRECFFTWKAEVRSSEYIKKE
ncbi:Os04g0581266 [Oryza sativa Japonica Group]|uniref:Os04g0581266 protein n=1 Tax=Oryza sativa subsp. japonica TaxID=39947 RepID=A0A0P0WE32_ORYSJ|nr:Os04g0581266 [Oryza sativa Japonica Group]